MTSSKQPDQQIKKSDFYELFLKELKDIYWTEKELVEKLPEMSGAASAEDLTSAIEEHHKETEGHVERLEKVFDFLEEAPEGVKCEAMEGLFKEAKKILKDDSLEDSVRDAGIIIMSQKVEHYEIAAYGSLIALGKRLHLEDCCRQLEETLQEEKDADAKLTQIAESHVNIAAAED